LFVLHNYTTVDRISGFFGAEEVQGSFLLRITPIFLLFFFYNKKNINLFFYYFFFLILMSKLILILI
jgi:hypothetical protein